MYIWLILAFIFAAVEALAVLKELQSLEYIAKPAVMICLFLWLYSRTGLRGNALWFGLGILFSLLGDVLLILPLDRTFLLGLIAFLLAHIFYIVGFRETLATISVWSFIVGALIAINVARLLRRITGVMQTKGENKLVIPVIIYGIVISVMLYAAMSTLSNLTWKSSAALLVTIGAFLFCASDTILVWNKFVSTIKNGRMWSITLYYLGQIGLVAGVISQFA